MVHLRVKIGIGAILGSFASIFFLQRLIGLNFAEYSTQLAVGITLIIIGIGYWTFKPQIEILISKVKVEEKQEKIETHKKHILEILHNNFYAYFPEYDQGDKGGIPWTNLPMYPYLLSHLRSYPEIWESFEKARKNSEEIIQEIDDKLTKAKTIVRKTLDSFTELPESSLFQGYKPNYSKNDLIVTLFKNIASAINNNSSVKPFIIRQMGNNPSSYLITDNNRDCAYGDENPVQKLFSLVRPLESDPNIHSLIKEIEDLKKHLWQNPLWKDFNQKREQLLQNLTYGQRDLQGHCDYCP